MIECSKKMVCFDFSIVIIACFLALLLLKENTMNSDPVFLQITHADKNFAPGYESLDVIYTLINNSGDPINVFIKVFLVHQDSTKELIFLDDISDRYGKDILYEWSGIKNVGNNAGDLASIGNYSIEIITSSKRE